MKNFLSIVVLTTLFATQAFSNESAYQLPITRDGVTNTRVAYNFWSGEYPQPVIDVQADTTVMAYNSLRVLDEQVPCSISAGVYHMWGKTGNDVINYYSIAGINTYKVTETYVDEEIYDSQSDAPGYSFTAGDLITNIVYGGEGWCVGTHVDKDGKRKDISLFCDGTPEKMEVVEQDWDIYEQWVYLQCKEGYNAFIQDIDFLNQPNVAEGRIGGYGDAWPAE